MADAGNDFASVVPCSNFERISGEPQAHSATPSICADDRGVLQRLSGALVLPKRSDEQALQCKLACIIGWMQSQRIEVPLSALMMLSDMTKLRVRAGRDLLRLRQQRQHKCPDSAAAEVAEPFDMDDKTALRLAIAECELLTAPVTARSVSSVDDASYIGCQLRRTLSTRLFSVALASFGIGILLTFVHAITPKSGHFSVLGVAVSDPSFIANCLLAPTERLCWGLVGASFYLLRRLYDFTEQRTFDYRMVGMYKVRLIMGGIAGGILSLLIDGDITADEPSKAVFGSHAIAFIGGFSVRAVYALIERVTEIIRDQFARGHTAAAPGAAQPPQSSIRAA